MASSTSWHPELVKFQKLKGKMKLWAGVLGMDNMESTMEENRRNSEAESAAVRRTLWGEQSATDAGKTNEEMRQTILGDNIHPAPIIMPHQQSNLPTIIALASTLGLGGMIGYVLTRSDAPAPAVRIEQPSPEFDDSSISVGLGRIEDYQPKDEQ